MTTLSNVTPEITLFGKRLAALFETIRVVAPIVGFASADVVTKAIVVAYQVSATQAQKDQVAAIIAAFDWSAAGQTAWEDTKNPDFATIRSQAAAAIQTNNTYLAIVSPTNADRFTQLDALTRENTQIIKALVAIILRLTGR